MNIDSRVTWELDKRLYKASKRYVGEAGILMRKVMMKCIADG
jgi:hypothetical protein